MIRITELKLPLDHDEHALPALIVKTLGIASTELVKHTIYKRSYDARKQKLLLVYIVDVQVEMAATLVASRAFGGSLPLSLADGADFGVARRKIVHRLKQRCSSSLKRILIFAQRRTKTTTQWCSSTALRR
jgi:hypothetical protein